MPFSEDFLHYIWKFRLFDQKDLKTTSAESIEIISVGNHNLHAGPDFENARIKIGPQVWAGNVEIHLRSSDWERHHHHLDGSYDNVILHVTYYNDMQIFRQNGTEIPQLVLDGLILEGAANRYDQLMHSLNWIPCEKLAANVDKVHVNSWLSRMLVDRLEEKCEDFYSVLNECKGSWENAFYIFLARNFGFKTNALPFELLARSLSQAVLSKHKNNALQIEALIFGQAGFLQTDFKDAYPLKLKKEYLFLQGKYHLKPIDKYLWKYLRLRPQNFPCVRLAQFAALVFRSSHLFSRLLEAEDIKSVRELFTDLEINPYWESHFRFDIISENSSGKLGDQSLNTILINTASVTLFAYGRYIKQDVFTERAIRLLEDIPAETNQVINRFNKIGFKAESAYSSQALLHLKSRYCDLKKCLHCGIGIKLLKTNAL